MPEVCANCERPIGKLETPFVFAGDVVCGECHARLSNAAPATPSQPDAPEASTIRMGGKTFSTGHITAAAMAKWDATPSLGILLAAVGGFVFCVGFVFLFSHMEGAWPAIGLGLAGAAAGLYFIANHQASYGIEIWTTSGGSEIIEAPDYTTAARTHHQIVQTISKRKSR